MNCRKVQSYLSAHSDSKLSSDRSNELEVHIRNCKRCEQEKLFFDQISATAKSLPTRKLPDDFNLTLMNRIYAEQHSPTESYLPTEAPVFFGTKLRWASAVAAVCVCAVVAFFGTLAQAVNIPLYVYNNPKASGVTITPGFLRHLADVGVQGIKDSGFSFIELTHFMLAMEDRPKFRFIVGTEALALPAFLIGAKGSVAGLANAFPELVVQLWDLFQAGEYQEAARAQMRVTKARQILHIPSSTNAACYAVLHERGIDVGHPKPPILPVTKEKREAMIAGFKEMGLL